MREIWLKDIIEAIEEAENNNNYDYDCDDYDEE